MSEPRAQRTLVKSPPELWAEISDLSTLARHLGEFGEIRITRVEAETTVVWEGDRARGTVELEPSGWGTKVTLTAAAIAVEAVVEAPVVEQEPVAAEPEPEPEPVVEDEQRRAGFLARLFGRRAKAEAAPAAQLPPAPPAAEPEPEPEPEAVAEPAFDGDRVEAVLVGVLDDLGSAHHRPFSRG
ncbi:MAG TPA: hypothetical protein VI318_17310 [Baekduia sp.]